LAYQRERDPRRGYRVEHPFATVVGGLRARRQQSGGLPAAEDRFRGVAGQHTVHFSNHTGYGQWQGSVLYAEDVADIIRSIEDRGVLPGCDAVLSGYMGDESLGEVVVGAVGRVKELNSKAIYCCDPVMGDAGRGFFVGPGIPRFIKEVAVPAADVITPNQFEGEFLTGVEVRDLDDALGAADEARRLGPETVLTTSLRRWDAAADTIEMLAVSEEGRGWSRRRCWRLRSTAPGMRRQRCSWRTCCGTAPWRRRC
jgi:pyridoxal kinase